MSQVSQQPYDFEPLDPDEDDVDEWLKNHRDALEFEANSDAPDAWVFQRYVNYVDSLEGSS